MVVAYVLLITEAGHERNVVDKLLQSKHVIEARIIYGQYDILAKIELADVAQLSGFMMQVVRPITGVRDSSTMISAD